MRAVHARRLSNSMAVVVAASMLAAMAVLVPAAGARPLNHAAASAHAATLKSSASLKAAQGALPTLYVEYTMGCTFSIIDDAGKPVTSIAPGTYQVEVQTPIMFKLVDTNNLAPNDFTGCKGWVQFQLTGPGVSMSTTLDTGCDSNYLIPSESFKSGATYVAQDLNQPAATRTSFSTLATGTPTLPSTSPYSSTYGKQTQTDLIGSQSGIQGTIKGLLSASGKPTLTAKGKAVSSLAAGKYTFAVTDKDPKASFIIRPIKAGGTKNLTGVAFVGTHSATVTLTAGQWMYYSALGKARYFFVTRAN